jgi:hypothetical protein
MGYRAVRNPL